MTVRSRPAPTPRQQLHPGHVLLDRRRTKVALAGDEDAKNVALPFPVKLYGVSYTSASVTTNGLVNFLEPRLGRLRQHRAPAAAKPNGIVAAFWDDLTLDKKSSVQTAVTGNDRQPEVRRRLEQRRLRRRHGRVTFEAVFDEATGAITLQYKDRGAGPRRRAATVGIENQTGTDALQHSFNETVLTDASAIRFAPEDHVMRTTPGGRLRLASTLVAAGLALTAAPGRPRRRRRRQFPAEAHRQPGRRGWPDRAHARRLRGRRPRDGRPAGRGRRLRHPQHGRPRAPAPTSTAPVAPTAPSPSPPSPRWRVCAAWPPPSLPGQGRRLLHRHSLGNVQRSKADGTSRVARDNASLYADWQVKPSRPWQTEPYPARVVMGYNAVSPFTPASDQGYVTGDLTGDGVDDVVFSASVGVNPYRPFTSPGSSLANGTFVTVLDGKTGKTLWSKLYAYAYNVKLVGKTLVVTDAPYYNLNSPADATATLTGIRFSYADGALTPTDTWTYDTELRAGDGVGRSEDLGDGLVAASWNQRKTATRRAAGHTLVLDTADGTVKWQTDSALYVAPAAPRHGARTARRPGAVRLRTTA